MGSRLDPAPCRSGLEMTEQQEFDALIAGLPTKAEELFTHWSPERKAEWVQHVSERAQDYRVRLDDGMRKALEYLRA